MQRLLVIRGGAIGDFIVTLPAIGALRQAFPQAHIEVVGNPRRAILARHPAYADKITDLEALDLYRLFSQHARVPERLVTYLRSFEAIFAYLPDSNQVVAARLRQYCPGYVVTWPPQPPGTQWRKSLSAYKRRNPIENNRNTPAKRAGQFAVRSTSGRHVTDHLLQPVYDFEPQAYALTPRVYLPAAALEAAARFWRQARLPETGVIALHPGSGGAHKVWPLPGWQRVMQWIAHQDIPCILLCGPADQKSVAWLLRDNGLPPWPCAGEMPLLHLAAIMARCRVVVGHDSGVTHLAAAAGSTTLALFGPTDPLTWAPRSPRVCVLQPQDMGLLSLDNLAPELVIETLERLWQDTFPFSPSDIACTICRVPGERSPTQYLCRGHS